MKTIAGFLLVLGACTPFAPDLDDTPYLCGDSEPRCPDGYRCVEGSPSVCVSDNGEPPDNSFNCKDDSALEGNNRNDDIAHAFVTPVDTPKTDFPLTDLAICPAGDRDTYAINLTMTNKGIKVTTSWAGGEPVTAVIMNSGGATIAPAMPDGGTASKACATNLPPQTYYVQASAAASAQNNYNLTITVIDNCTQ
jgi:hypothetical protein